MKEGVPSSQRGCREHLRGGRSSRTRPLTAGQEESRRVTALTWTPHPTTGPSTHQGLSGSQDPLPNTGHPGQEVYHCPRGVC